MTWLNYSHVAVALSVLMLTCAPYPAIASAQQVRAQMERYQWTHRVLVIFSPRADAAEYIAQRQMLRENTALLEERDVVVWEIVADDFVRTNGAARPQLHAADFYSAFDVADVAAFTAILIGKDGEEKLRQFSPITASKLQRVVDAMPMRRREMLRSTSPQ